MRVLLFADGDLPSVELLQELAAAADLVIAADGGVDKALAAEITPAAVIGDLDSVSPEATELLPQEAFHFVPSPDSTDLQKTIEHALNCGATEIDIVAAGGGRADHALANLSVLTLYRGRGHLRIVDDLFVIELVQSTTVIDEPEGTVVSLVAIGQCEGVTTTGLRWNLTDHPLAFSPQGIHNEVQDPPATVSVRSGDLLLFRGRWIERNV